MNKPQAAANSSPTPGSATSSGVDSLEDQLIALWTGHRQKIMAITALVLVALVVSYVWAYVSERQDAAVSRAFSAAATAPELRSFIAEHSGHPLASLAQLSLAHDLFSEGNYSEAATAYDEAAGNLSAGPFAEAARLGSALSRAAGGQTAAAEAALRQIGDDAQVSVTVRSEALYHQVNLASIAGRMEDVNRLSDQLLQLDPSGAWAQRALLIRADQLPTAAESVSPSPAGVLNIQGVP
jgi:hypothetical protein